MEPLIDNDDWKSFHPSAYEKSGSVVLDLPEYLHYSKSASKRYIVSIDVDIVDVMKHLWANKVYTLSCCSGHGKVRPSLVIEQGLGLKEMARIEELISEITPGARWEIHQWRLTKMN